MVFNEGFILQSSSVTVCGSNERLLSFKEICWHFFSMLKKCQESAIVQITLPREGFIVEKKSYLRGFIFLYTRSKNEAFQALHINTEYFYQPQNASVSYMSWLQKSHWLALACC